MKATKLMMLAAATMGLAACSSEEDVIDNSTPVAMQINASIASQGLTRTTTDYATGATSWDKEDAIGIFAISVGADEFSNKKYVTTEGNGTFTYGGTKTAIFLTNATLDYYVYAYYPFEGDEDDEIRNTNTINTGIQGEPKKLDFLFAKVEGITKANLKVDFTGDNAFKHTMSQLILKIKTDATAGFAATDVKNGNYYLSGLKLTGKVFKVVSPNLTLACSGWLLYANNYMVASTPPISFGVQPAIVHPLNSMPDFLMLIV